MKFLYTLKIIENENCPDMETPLNAETNPYVSLL